MRKPERLWVALNAQDAPIGIYPLKKSALAHAHQMGKGAWVFCCAFYENFKAHEARK